MRQREAIFCKFVVQQTAIQRGAERWLIATSWKKSLHTTAAWVNGQ